MMIDNIDNNIDIEKLLSMCQYKDIDYNKEVLTKIKNVIENDIDTSNIVIDEVFVKNLYDLTITKEWKKAQYFAIYEEIKQVLQSVKNAEIQTRNLIYEICNCNYIYLKNKKIYEIAGGINYHYNCVLAQQMFNHITEKIPFGVKENFNLSKIPCLRMAIELKIVEILDIEHIKAKNKKNFIPVSKLISFIKNNKEYFDFPIDFSYLKYINRWTNLYIHSGVVPYYWQTEKAIELISPLFNMCNRSKINVEGFTFRKNNFKDFDFIFISEKDAKQ